MARTKYFYVWIEGLSPRNGELLSKLTDNGYEITNKITEALRVKEKDITELSNYLSRHGVADWVLDNPNSFVRTNYVPSGTLLNLDNTSI